MSEVSKKRAAAMLELLDKDETMSEGHDDSTDPECWRESFLESAFEEAVSMVTQASMAYDEEHGEMNDQPHPMDVIRGESLLRVYATSRPWAVPVVVVEVAEAPAYFENGMLTDVREVYARRKPGLSADPTHVKIQIRQGRSR